MQNHDHTNLIHRRAEIRQDYARIYMCVRPDASDALRDSKDGLILGWTKWDEAHRFANKTSMIVVNWGWFVTHYLPRLPDRPAAARIIVETKKETFRYHAEFDASPDELRTLNAYNDWEVKRRPGVIAKRLANAKVWPEDES